MTEYLNILLAVVVAAMLCACHSNEKNYRESYEKAIELNRTGDRGEQYQQELARRTQNNFVVDGDSIRLVRLNYKMTDDSVIVAKKYGAVVAEFHQRFNALSCRDRLRQQEHLPAYVVETGDKTDATYYVIAQGFDDISTAATFVKNPEKYLKMKVLVPKAWVIVHTNRSELPDK